MRLRALALVKPACTRTSRAAKTLPLVLYCFTLAGHAGPAWAQLDAAFPLTAATGAMDVGSLVLGSASDLAVDPIQPPVAAPGGVLGTTGTGPRVGGVRDALAASVNGPPLQPAARAWTVSPSLGLGEEYTDNVFGLGGGGLVGAAGGSRRGGSDLVTLVQPGLSMAGSTTRLQGSLSYTPVVEVFARHPDYTQVDQNFGGQVLAALVPGILFVDLRGFGTVVSNGLGAGTGTVATTQGGATQTVDLAVSPYALRRFGHWGTGEIGASLERTTESGVDGTGGRPATASPFNLSGDQRVTTTSGHVAFQTGEAFARFSGTALGYVTSYDGTGVLDDASRDTATLTGGYAVTHRITALATIGYEHIRYGGTAPLLIDDEIWNLGMRVTPGPGSSIAIGYGHHDGLDVLNVDAAVQPTMRTRLFLRYSEGLTTQSEQLQNTLATSDFDQLGDPVDHTTGAPLLATSGLFGAQNSLYRSSTLSATATLVEERDVFTAGVVASRNTVVSYSGLPDALGSNKGLYASLGWQRNLSPTLELSAFAQYGVLDNASPHGGAANAAQRDAALAGHQTVVTGTAALGKALSETLSGQLRYSYNRISGGGIGFVGYSANVVLLSLAKSF